MNIQKSVAFLFANNEISEKGCKQTIPFKITLKNTFRYSITNHQDNKEVIYNIFIQIFMDFLEKFT